METAPSPSFGTLLRRYRGAAGLSQEELAERAGLSARTVGDLERGASKAPRKDTVALLAQALVLASRLVCQSIGRVVIRAAPSVLRSRSCYNRRVSMCR
jgi:transcriptional regulator with XRE-family HTH domain